MTSEAFRALGCYFERGFEREAGFDEFAFFEEAADERDAMGDAAGWGEFWQGVLGDCVHQMEVERIELSS